MASVAVPLVSLLKDRKPITFIPTLKPARALTFYRDVLGINFISQDDFALAFDLAGTMLRIVTVPQLSPATYTVLGWQVPDIIAAANALTHAGVVLERYAGLNDKDELGIWAAPGGTRIAWFKDPDGNLLSITQF